MTTRQEAIAACLQLPDVYEDYPFDDFNWTAIRHRANQKIFALIFERENHIWINVKAQPMWVDFWRRTFSAVVPAYHMNKEHWISIILDGSMKDVDIRRLIEESFALTAPKTRIPRIQNPCITLRSADCKTNRFRSAACPRKRPGTAKGSRSFSL